MPRFKIIQYRDACQRFEVEIDAESPQEALDVARENDCDWKDCGVSIYDNADMEVQDLDVQELIPAHSVW